MTLNPYTVVIPAAGQGKRMKRSVNKQFIEIGGHPVLSWTLRHFEAHTLCQEIIVVVHPNDMEKTKRLVKDYRFQKVTHIVCGGKERQDSIYNGLQYIGKARYVMVHDGARPFVQEKILNDLCAALAYGSKGVIPAVKVKDTIKLVSEAQMVVGTLPREQLAAAQTPQAFCVELLLDAYAFAVENQFLGTDDASLIEYFGKEVQYIDGDYDNIKITTEEDLDIAEKILAKSREPDTCLNFFESKNRRDSMFKIGQGFDVHQLAENRPCIIGGVEIPFEKGLLGHSDADVLLHAISDAILGALALGDIGRHFPDTDVTFKDADSKILLQEVWKMAAARGYIINNLDCVVMAERPKMAPYISQITEKIAHLLNCPQDCVNVKATTTEKLGFTGREEGIAAQAIVLLKKQ
ncbi:MAG: bifunctional 2-C-methyl-D-erythritol 4-phosphate cytidylyltransferase/2-C-methyl-D-erythritol 2,4-cyclodiphosphate synthase [Bacillales bacterium]|nr:bifunctional 2-C-methyl-D-erythritol 4-phosphate cytidylyltransferase/2-C-methyl-D-erythritol 2,4-cyclodiphosphate synthase [Bacillales bacterium]